MTMILMAGFSTRGRSISGWVFFISTAGFNRGSAKTVIRAVSFFGDDGAGIAAAADRAGQGESSWAGEGFAGGRVGK